MKSGMESASADRKVASEKRLKFWRKPLKVSLSAQAREEAEPRRRRPRG